MPNQVLALHRVSPRCYDLAGVRTGNVRDQLLRSTVVVNALASEGMIGTGLALLVYGAGAAGMNAAMLAAALHADVTVVERTDEMFSSIAGTWLRRIDPTEYDWPHEHWRTSLFPSTGTIPLPQKSALCGASLAAAWIQQWNNFLATWNGKNGFGTVTVVHNLDAWGLVQSDIPANPFLEVTGRWQDDSSAIETKQFGALLSCTGHGPEQVSEVPLYGLWHQYTGPGFWTDGDGIAPYWPLPGGVSSVVISGAGDGGMQDLQRVATSFFGRELFERLEMAAGRNPDPEYVILPTDTLLKTLLSAEETARRAFSWAASRHGAPRTLMKWHNDFKDAIEQVVSGWSDEVALHVAQYLFRKDLFAPQPRLQITWVMRDPTPGYAYALNRYLVLLLSALANRVLPGRLIIHRSSTIHSITPLGHSCKKASDCVGKKHIVEIDAGDPTLIECEADLIIIRHGVEHRPLLLGGRVPVPEQISPFDLPH